MCAIVLSAVLVSACVKCAVRRAVKVIRRRVREHTIEKTIHIYICDRIWENSPLRAQYDFSVEAFIVYLT